LKRDLYLDPGNWVYPQLKFDATLRRPRNLDLARFSGFFSGHQKPSAGSPRRVSLLQINATHYIKHATQHRQHRLMNNAPQGHVIARLCRAAISIEPRRDTARNSNLLQYKFLGKTRQVKIWWAPQSQIEFQTRLTGHPHLKAPFFKCG
jgi:hypothetical protein